MEPSFCSRVEGIGMRAHLLDFRWIFFNCTMPNIFPLFHIIMKFLPVSVPREVHTDAPAPVQPASDPTSSGQGREWSVVFAL